MKITFAEKPQSEIVAFVIEENGSLPDAAKPVDKEANGLLSEALGQKRFTGKHGQVAVVVLPKSCSARRAILIGGGKPDALDARAQEKVGALLVKSQASSGFESLSLHVDDADFAVRGAQGAMLASYRFDDYFTKLKDDDKPSLKTFELVVPDERAASTAWEPMGAAAEGTALARDLMNMPPNLLYPETFAEKIKELKKHGIEVEILGEKEMEKLGMGALLGVGQGSVKESKLGIMKWMGGKKGEAPVALCGKGVCFDTGGISLKPGPGMENMRGDMGGAAAVTGAMLALARRKAKANVVGLVGLVENMPDGNAIRPGDILTSASGQTIEVLNTDAEGRLVLADVLWYAQKEFKPKSMVDLATLTGAIVVSLGHHHAGMFTDDEAMAAELTKAGLAEGERVWRLPIGPEYDRQIKSQFADMKNIGGKSAGSITAAQFLKRFVNEGQAWTHLDIAGVAWVESEKSPLDPSWASGFGPRLLDRWIADNYED
jgi:leucyl aminopeptidase